MKILGICLSTGKGGLELYAHKAIQILHGAGHECHFALAPDSFLSQREWSLPLIELQPVSRHFPIMTARKLARYIDAQQIDIIHMHWNKDLNLVALAKVLSRRKPKLVYTRHMEITRSKKDLYHRFLYRQVDRMLVIARFVLEQAIRYLPLAREQITLLYLGVKEPQQATEQECSGLMPGLRGHDRRFVIGMIGRIEPYKGQHVLIAALQILKRQNIHPAVAMAGAVMDQAYFDKLMQQVQVQDLAEQVNYLGISAEPDKLMSCCDVIVLTTQCETFGLVLIEAMRAGTAVVGTNAGGVPEIITDKETGLLFEPGNAEELAVCLAELYQNQTRREDLARAGKTFADATFTEQNHFDKLASILASL
jgi:glycosyltransferase involved in cell wall biosynthesis